MDRRRLLLRLAQGLILSPLAWIGVRSLTPQLWDDTVQKIVVGRADELFATKSYTIVQLANTPAIIFRRENRLEALSMLCTHASCTVRFDEKASEFQCPCHGGAFHADGTVKSEPPRKALQRLFVSEHDGIVYLSSRVIG